MSSVTSSDPVIVAVLGTGIMGAPIALNLARKGFAVRAWNRTGGRAEALSRDGIAVFDAPAKAVTGARIVITMLKDGDSVRQTMEAASPNLVKGVIWLQLSTVGVEAIDALAMFASGLGAVFYDAPVQGTRQPAEQGQLTILAAGPEDHRRDVNAVFDAIGKETRWLSATAGVASRLKLALNAWVFAMTHGIAESLSIAEALGVNPELVVDVIAGGPLDSGYFRAKASATLAGNFATSFSVDNGFKDSELILSAVEAANGPSLDIVRAGRARFERVIAQGRGDGDIAATYLA